MSSFNSPYSQIPPNGQRQRQTNRNGVQHLAEVIMEQHKNRRSVQKIQFIRQLNMVVISERNILHHHQNIRHGQPRQYLVNRRRGHVLPRQHGHVQHVRHRAEETDKNREVPMVVLRVLADQIDLAAAGRGGDAREAPVEETHQLLAADVELLQERAVLEDVHDLVVADHHHTVRLGDDRGACLDGIGGAVLGYGARVSETKICKFSAGLDCPFKTIRCCNVFAEFYNSLISSQICGE